MGNNKKKGKGKGATKEGYLRHTRFRIGEPSKGGNSEGVLVVYYDNNTKVYYYSKDCKHLYKYAKTWSFNRYGLPYLRSIWHNGGDDKYKIDSTKAVYAAVYPSVFEIGQTPIEILYKRPPSVTNFVKSKFQLLIPKRLDLRRNDADRFHSIFSKDGSGNTDIDTYLSFMSMAENYATWENFGTPKAVGRMTVYDTATRKIVAEMSNSCLFFKPYSNIPYPFVTE